jgi:hypothetical protein
MATYFERIGQRDWADRTYEKALDRRRHLPQPIGWASGFGDVNAPFLRLAASRSLAGIDPERQHLWLERGRELLGAGILGDDFASLAWSEHFLTGGKDEEAEREVIFFRQARRHPLNNIVAAAKRSSARLASRASILSCSLLVILLLGRAIRRCVARGISSEGKGDADRHEGRTALPVPRVDPWSSSVGSVLLGLTVALWLLGEFAFYYLWQLKSLYLWSLWAFAHGKPYGEVSLISIALFFAALAVGSRLRGTGVRVRDLVASISRGERVLLAVALVLSVLWTGLHVHAAFDDTFSLGMAVEEYSDSLGHPTTVAELERQVARAPNEPFRFAAAVANHLAGNVDRALELYADLDDHPRAARNLEALRKGSLVPPESLTAGDLRAAFLQISWETWGRSIFWFFGEARFIRVPIAFLVLSAHLLGLVMLAAFVIVRPRVHAAPSSKDHHAGRIKRTAFYLVPGLFDMSRGAAWRGYLAFLTCAFVLLACLSIQGFLLIFPVEQGPLSWLVRDAYYWIPFPAPPGPPGGEALLLHYYWTFFWGYPYAKLLWSAVALGAVTSLALHVARFGRIRRAGSLPD